jgi:hypothetical protein
VLILALVIAVMALIRLIERRGDGRPALRALAPAA